MPELTVDVVVVGYGPAGAAAALAARAGGADVLVVEAGSHGGGNALYSGGFLFDVPGPACLEHLDSLSFGRTDREVLSAYAEGLHENADWLAALGAPTERFDPPPIRLPAPFPSWPNFPAGKEIEYRVVSGGTGRRGSELWNGLAGAVAERNIPIRFETPVVDLLLDDGRVAGVVTATGETVHARGGVVLACGGFEADPALADAYLPLPTGRQVGHGRNDGAGIRLAQRAGAALWHMYGFFGWFAYTAPEHPSAFAIDFFAPGHLFVNADGHRFADETGFEVHDRLRALSTYLPRNPNRPRLPCWAVFDEPTRLAGPLNGLLGTPNDYVWSADNAAEIERGWIVRADDDEQLAARIGVDPAVFAQTLAEYDAAAQAGVDPRFGRSADTLVPLAPGPRYAIQTQPGVAGTTGGPRHDSAGRVLRDHGAAVPGLYAAGGVSMVWGHLIDHGGGLTDALVFGRLAGAEAAKRATRS
ncbi:FAD-dependent oxidoreductase [uncultured Jatrophihabitans sp.]|uniref:FAD-dependent oxidoreductase n=1 Tax=uncultured Jatrophihabitans sp. TaxID=1610747 RepID=UPI0035CC28EA